MPFVPARQPFRLPCSGFTRACERGGRAQMRSPRSLPTRAEIGDEPPLRLAIAPGRVYPAGSMTAGGLRREAAKGRLAIERTAGKDYTTLAAIERMRELCRKPPRDRACSSDEPGGTPK